MYITLYNKSLNKRYLTLEEAKNDSVFLWGARQAGKSTLLKSLFPDARYYDLLKNEEFVRLNQHPEYLRQELSDHPQGELVIIDEVQKIPALLDEVHWLITNRNIRFILCGSSARKLKRGNANMLGGRALRTVLFPFVSAEISNFNLDHALNHGMLPRHYLIENPSRRIEAYISNYLIEEIKAEALTRNLATFNRFMEIAAISCGEQLNFNNIASECGVSSPTIKEYFTILEDTMLGYMIPAFRKKAKRRLVMSPRFYYFDIGITNFLLKRNRLTQGSPEYGKAFEHFIILELVAYLEYTNSRAELTYWRTSSGLEVDAVLGDANVAIEIKSAREIQNHHLKGLKAFAEEYPGARKILVSNEKYARRVNDIELIPAYPFLEQLWNGSII